ncbi:MAG: outer membrane lipoprotein carrier protein LolA [Deltaproteobacteria bacterium]|nr:outer membrane lipoprotein carrier protein LolA [Deltaproteobacteria bacterium]
MKKTKTVLISHLLVLFFCIPAVADDRLSGVLEGIGKKYGNLTGFSVSYTREVVTRSMTMLGSQIKGDLATGKVYFKAPYSLRLEQETPAQETIIADNNTLLWLVPGKKIAYEYSSRTFGMELRLLSDIFNGFSEIENRFTVSAVHQDDPGCCEIELRPDAPWQDVDRIVVNISEGYFISGVHIHNQFGSITSFRLSDMVERNEFESSFFSFIVPEGMRLIKE